MSKPKKNLHFYDILIICFGGEGDKFFKAGGGGGGYKFSGNMVNLLMIIIGGYEWLSAI